MGIIYIQQYQSIIWRRYSMRPLQQNGNKYETPVCVLSRYPTITIHFSTSVLKVTLYLKLTIHVHIFNTGTGRLVAYVRCLLDLDLSLDIITV